MPTRTCFVIAPIGERDSEARKRSDKVLKHVFRKALEDKFHVVRADEIDQPGMITSQVLRAVQESDLVVADLTGHNPNVFYELAVRHAVEKPIIHVIELRLSKIPFDVGGFRTIDFDLTDPDSIENAVDKLRKQAEQALAGNWGENPIKLANIMKKTQGDSPELVLIKQAVEGIANVSARISRLESSTLFTSSGYLSSGPMTSLRDMGGGVYKFAASPAELILSGGSSQSAKATEATGGGGTVASGGGGAGSAKATKPQPESK